MGSSPPASDDDRYQDDLWRQPTHARILVSDAEAGSIIGRGGSAVATVQSTSGAHVQLSRRGQLLPGTDSRVLLLSGLFHQVMDATELILRKISCQGDQVIDDLATVVLVVPNACCSALIGTGGTVIKSLSIASNAGIVISPQDICYGLQERLVTIRGHLDNQLQAIFLILSKLLEDDCYSWSYAGVPFPYHVSSAGFEDHGPDEHIERYHNRPNTPKRSQEVVDAEEEMIMHVVLAASSRQGGGSSQRLPLEPDATPQQLEAPLVDAEEEMIMHVVLAASSRQGGGSRQRLPLEPDATPQQLEAPLEQDRSVYRSKKAIQSDTVLQNLVSCGYEAPAPVLPIESWTESDELVTEDGEDAYFRALVDKFIAAAYPPEMVVASVHGQQEAATTPSASTRTMKAHAARQVAELESAEPTVSTGSGVGSASLVGKTVITRMVPRERYTWKYQTTEDGPNGLTVLSHVKKQLTKKSCLPTAMGAVMESNLRVQLGKDTILSLEHLDHLSHAGRTKFSDEAAVKRLILMVKNEGVLSEKDYEILESGVRRYYITKYHHYKVGDRDDMRHALHKLRNEGPLMGIIRISENYDECAKSGHIYKYDPDCVEKDEQGKPKSITHAVCIISFAIEDGVPFLECQDSHGDRFGNKGFLKIDVTSLSHIWSIAVA